MTGSGRFKHCGARVVELVQDQSLPGRKERAVHKGLATWSSPSCTASISLDHCQAPQPTVASGGYPTTGRCQDLFRDCRTGLGRRFVSDPDFGVALLLRSFDGFFGGLDGSGREDGRTGGFQSLRAHMGDS
ncbi:hypothetical protein LCGC14_1358220 [marine sediment metagenome]|uniref:Uncharacterized protein n=1 Tax=marine sediment metagenome TaxID=412755 RepID=A0A0F9K8U6_9ZZZZ